MNRRLLLIRTLTGAMSATVFTATGWLMGTRTLTMNVGDPPGPCGDPPCPPGEICNRMCGDFWKTCVTDGCPTGQRKFVWTRAIGCNGDASCPCACNYTFPQTTCSVGSC